VVQSVSEFVLKRLLSHFHLPLADHSEQSSAARSIVVLAPHIDDETISCGGTIRQHTSRGDTVTVVFLTDGSRCANASPGIVERREAEAQRAVGHVLGVQHLLFWRYPDQGLNLASGMLARLETLLSELSPDLLYVPTSWDRHPDHIAAANVSASALRHVKQSVRIYESFCPQTPYLTNCSVDISGSLPAKIAAMKEFTSQVVSFESILLLNRVNAAAADKSGAKAVEVFLEIPPSRYRPVFEALASAPIRPRQITRVDNVLRGYLVNFTRARRVRRLNAFPDALWDLPTA
jgi:LmbE family N-acetylglucosaminyl deacetylase